MARPRTKGAYTPLAAMYFMDDAILEAGTDAELLFVRCLSFLASVPSDGFITDRQLNMVGNGLRAMPRRVESLLKAGLIERVSGGFVVRSWLKWNRSAAEVGRLLAKDRQRKAQDSGAKGANSVRNPVGTESESAPQSSTEQSSTEQVPPNGGGTRSRATRIPEPFRLTPAMREWAAVEVPGLDVDRATRRFVDYWRSESGTKAAKRDWVATWRNWMRRDAERISQRSGHQPRPTRDEENLAVVARLAAQEAAAQIGLTA